MQKTNAYYPLVPFKTSEGMWGFKDSITEEIKIEPIYDDVDEFEEGIACVCFNGKYGIIDKSNNFIISPIHNYLQKMFGGVYEIYNEKNERSVIDITGTIYLTPEEQDGLYGYVDYDGNVVIPFQYEDAAAFSEGLAAVKKNGKWGYINKEGDVIIPFRWATVESFSEGFAVVGTFEYFKERWSDLINETVLDFFRKEDIDDAPDDVESWQKLDSDIGYINKKGEMLEFRLPEDVTLIGAEPFKEGRAYIYCYHYEWFNEHKRAFYIDAEGKIVCEVQDVDWGFPSFSCGRAAVYDFPNRWGYINLDGELVIPYQYQEIIGNMEFKDGYAIVKKNNLYGCIDVNGNEIVPCIYKEYDKDVVTFIKNHLESLKSD